MNFWLSLLNPGLSSVFLRIFLLYAHFNPIISSNIVLLYFVFNESPNSHSVEHVMQNSHHALVYVVKAPLNMQVEINNVVLNFYLIT